MEIPKNTISLNRKKIKASKACNNLYNEYTRDDTTAEHYDDGHRMIDTNRTADNILLKDVTGKGKLDAYRKQRIQRVNEARKGVKDATPDEAPASKKTVEEREKWAIRSNANRHRALRADTVDMIGNVVQLGNGALDNLTEEEQVQAYESAFNVINSSPEDYGDVLVASIHKDESSIHLQILTSAIDEDAMKSQAQSMFGNKSKMSADQTKFVERVQEDLKARGLDIDVNRGLQRVDNDEYRNFKDEMKASGYEVTRYNDKELKPAQEEVLDARIESKVLNKNSLDFAFNIFDSSQKLADTDFKYNREAMADGFDEDDPDDHYLTYTGNHAKGTAEYEEQHKQATSDVHEFNEIASQDGSVMKNIMNWYQDKLETYSEKAKDMYKKGKDMYESGKDKLNSAIGIKRKMLKGLGAEKTLPKPANNPNISDDDLIDSYAKRDTILSYRGIRADDEFLFNVALRSASDDVLKRRSEETLQRQVEEQRRREAEEAKEKAEKEAEDKKKKKQIDDGLEL